MLRNKFWLGASISALALFSCNTQEPRDCDPKTEYLYQSMTDSLVNQLNWPEDLDIKVFADAELVTSQACMAVSAQGDVFSGVDMIGS